MDLILFRPDGQYIYDHIVDLEIKKNKMSFYYDAPFTGACTFRTFSGFLGYSTNNCQQTIEATLKEKSMDLILFYSGAETLRFKKVTNRNVDGTKVEFNYFDISTQTNRHAVFLGVIGYSWADEPTDDTAQA